MESALKSILSSQEPLKVLFYRDKVFKLCKGVYEPSDESYFLAENADIHDKDTVLDIGTGTGILAISLADKARYVTATDMSKRALDCATENARMNNVLNINFSKGSLFNPVKGKQFDLIVSNTPHIPTPRTSYNEYVRMNVDGGPDGRKCIDQLIKEAKDHLNEGGRIQLVQSHVANIEKTISEFSKSGLPAKVTAEKTEPFGRTGCERIEYFKGLGIGIEYDNGIPLEKVCIITARRE